MAGPARHHVLIVGGGFAGLYAARELGKDDRFEVTLVDRHNYHLFQPLLYQVATGALGEIANDTLRRDFRSIDPSHARINLIEALDRILPTFPPGRSASAQRQLEKLGVTVRTETRVVDVQADSVRVAFGDAEETIPARTILWAAGVLVTRFAKVVAEATGADADRAGRVFVGPDLSVPGHPEIFVVGDAAV